jgi:hypothetical protein
MVGGESGGGSKRVASKEQGIKQWGGGMSEVRDRVRDRDRDGDREET